MMVQAHGAGRSRAVRQAAPLLLTTLLAACAGTPPAPEAPESAPIPSREPVRKPSPTPAPIPEAPRRPTPRPPAAVVAVPTPAPRPAISTESRALLQHLLPAGIQDRADWAQDILTAFQWLRIPAEAENLCATLAIIEQESSFQADPVVAGLDRIVWKEIEARRERLHLPKLLVDAALAKNSPDGRSYKARIDALRTERQMNALFEDMIAEIPFGRELLGGYNPVRTGGPMQVSVRFAEEHQRERGYPYPTRASVRSEVFTRRGGLYYGIAILLDYPAPYTRPIYRFADFNAGRFSSRNAAFQNAVARLARQELVLDGDLLRYTNGQPSDETSSTQQTLYALAPRLGLSRAELNRDLRLEKTAAFAQSPLYQRVFTQADGLGPSLPRELLPRIDLHSPKIQRKLTTAWFAERVDGRYQRCLERATRR